jgi:PhnB protein
MTVTVTPHLNFRGTARAALEHYQRVFGGELVAVTYADAHAVQDPAEADQVMWGQVTTPSGFAVMAYDVPGALPYDQGVRSAFVSVRGDSADEIGELWGRLAEDAEIVQDLGPAGWAPLYGMLTDPFGVVWVLDVAA